MITGERLLLIGMLFRMQEADKGPVLTQGAARLKCARVSQVHGLGIASPCRAGLWRSVATPCRVRGLTGWGKGPIRYWPVVI